MPDIAVGKEEIDIPAAAYLAKPIFGEMPDADVVEEIREWVKSNPTYLWRGHTHSYPDPDEVVEIRYVNDFQLPKGIEAPCPCCTPRHAKFGTGYIAWFPRSSCVRLMGRDCFRALNPDGHEFAVDELDQRRRRLAAIAFLTANLHLIPQSVRVLSEARPLAQHLDELQDILGERLRRVRNVDLWQCVRDGGQLKVIEQVMGAPRDRNQAFINYASIAGHALVDPARKKLIPAIDAAVRLLESIDLARIEAATDPERTSAIRAFNRGMGVGREALDQIRACRRFLSIETLATLRTWGALPNSPARLFARRDGFILWIGQDEQGAGRVNLQPCLDEGIGALPETILGE